MKQKPVKYLCLLLALAVFAMMAVASGSDPNRANHTTTATSTPQPIVPADTPITMEETPLADLDGVCVTATDYVSSTDMSEGISVYVENNGQDTVSVSYDSPVVNGCFVDSGGYLCTLEPGETTTATIDLYSSSLRDAGITTVGQVEVSIRLQFGSDFVYMDPVTIYTSAWEQALLIPDDSGTELYNADGFRMVAKSAVKDWDAVSVLLYLENSTGTDIWVEGNTLSVNGCEIEPNLISFVKDDTYAIGHIYIYNHELENAGIDDVEALTLSVHVFASEDHALLVETDPATFSVK